MSDVPLAYPSHLPPAVRSKRLSVVIPVKDDARALATCLASLERQLSWLDELIVVDNGSHDESADVARTFGATVVSESTPGIAAASAAGYDVAGGELIGRLDADSVPAPDWVDAVIAHFQEHPQSSGVTGWAEFTDGPPALRRLGAIAYLGAYFALVGLALGHVPFFGSNCAFRKSEWARVSGTVHRLDNLVHDDMDLSFHIGPTRRIRLSRTMRVGISSRPFYDGAGRLRARRGFHTIFTHWPHELPWLRFARRLLARTGRPGDSRGDVQPSAG